MLKKLVNCVSADPSSKISSTVCSMPVDSDSVHQCLLEIRKLIS